MKRILFLFFAVTTGLNTFAQPITADNTTYTVPQLVQNVLFAQASGSSSCIGTINNITWSTGTNFGSTNGIGYFTNTNPNFPLTSGVILSTGNALEAPGPNSSIQSFGSNAWPGDLDLFDYISGLGIIDPAIDEYNNATILEFDFVPLTNQMSFDFLFASEEYIGAFQCDYSDAFAFFLTNVTAGTAAVNLAVIPSTTTPISVTTIRDDAGSCGELNVAYFGSNNQGAAAAGSATDFNGQTTVITATSTVVPNNTYRIKLVIADLNDNLYDSAVFLGGGSFNIGTPNISGTGPYVDNTDFTIVNNSAVCGSTVLVIQAGSVAIPGATYEWTLGTAIVGTNSNLLTVTQPGTYGVTITYAGGCEQTDTITVEYLQSITLGTPANLTQCSAPFNLTQNTPAILNGIANTVSYHTTLAQAQQQAAPINTAANYNGTDGQIIYAAVEDFATGCIVTTQFTLNTNLSLCVVTPIAGSPPNLYGYETTFGGGTSIFDLTTQTSIIYGANPLTDFTVTYYTSMPNALAGTNAITGISTFQNTANPQIIYAVLSDNADSTNFTIVNFQLIVIALPDVSITGPTAVCDGSTATIIFTGTPNATVNYTENGNPRQIVLNASGSNTYVSAPLIFNATFNLVNIIGTSLAGTTTRVVTGAVTVNITYPPVINTPTNYVVCDDSLNNDGLYCFDLTTKDVEVSTDLNVVITYHETLTNAQTGANPLPNPYCNISNSEIFVRAYNLGASACYTTTSFFLIVNPIPLPNPVITDYPLCDYTNTGDGIEIFNLGTKTLEIANGQSGVTVSYYDSLVNAQSQTGALPNLYSSGSRPIWINIRNTTTGCNTTGTFNLVVNPLPLAVIPPPIFQCSNGTVLTAVFNLTVNEGTSTGGQTGRIVTYYNTLLAAQNGTPVIAAPTTYTGFNTEVVYIRVQDSTTGCFSITTQLLRVTQGPLAVTPQDLEICDPNRDGFGSFNLASTILEIQGGAIDPNVTVTFHETQDDATLGGNALGSTYTNINPYLQTIYVRVFYTLSGCANYLTLDLIVHDNPLATVPTDYPLCDSTGASNTETFNLTIKIPEILGSLSPTQYAVTFYTSLPDAQAPNNAISNIAAYVSGTQTLYVRVQDNTTGCFDIVTLNLIVNPLPNATQPNYPQYSLCDNDQSNIGFEVFDLASKVNAILLGQTGMSVIFYRSLANAQNDTNPIFNLFYQNQIIYVQTLGIRITNVLTGCFVISTMDIRVEPLPTLIPPTQPYALCDEDQDGFTAFDLTTLLPGLLGSTPSNYTVSFHETFTDAQNDSTTILDATAYTNINPFVQILYVRAEDNTTGCFSVITIELTIDPSPVAPVLLDDIVVCDTDNNPQNGNTNVNLTQRTVDALAQQPLSASNYIIEYYNSLAAAQAGTLPIINATNYLVSNGATIWVRVENVATGCYNLGTFKIIINAPLLLTTPAPLSLCDDDPNNQFHEFDLTVKNLEIAPGGEVVTYYSTYALALAAVAGTQIQNPTAYVNTSAAVQTLGVVVTTAAGCKSVTTLDIRVLPIPTPNRNPPALAPKCDDNNPGDLLEIFDLTVNQAYIRNNDPSLTFHYFPTLANAQANNTAFEFIPPTAALVGGNVFIRVENNRVDYQGNNCYVIVEQALTVNPLPTVIQPLAPFRVCDDNADGIADFDFTSSTLATALLGATQLPANFTISYYLTAANAATGTAPLPATYTNVTPTSQNVFIRVVNNATGCVNATGILTLAVEAYATATQPAPFEECDDYNDPYDGIHRIDLTQYAATILNGQDPAIFLVSYYTSLADAVAGNNPLTPAEAQAYETDPDTDTIWVKVENSSNSITPFCYAITTIIITVERYPNPIITTANGVTTICVDFVTGEVLRPLTLDSGITNPANYTFEWFENGATTPITGATGPTYTVNTAEATGATRSYTVHVTSNSLGCDTTSASFDVIQSGPAVIAAGTVGYTVTNAFSAAQIITVTVEGYGTYEYSLDDGPRQTSNVFENVTLGEHVIRVWDSEGGVAYSCEELIILNVQVIDYPHYFTPNGDGIHDTWNIVGLDGKPNTKIYIFDRYGKLIKQISSQGQGWDGTYNGQLLPSDDYWFTVDFIEQTAAKQFKAHFSLKR